MAKKEAGRARRRRVPAGHGGQFLQNRTLVGTSRAFESHLEELSYEMLKDPEYQELLRRTAEELFTALAAGFRKQRAQSKRRKK